LKKIILLFSVLALIIAVTAQVAYADPILWAVDRESDQLRLLDTNDASTVSSVTITLAGEDIKGATGLALDPTTGKLWASIRLENLGPGVPGERRLVTINPDTGVATNIGTLGDAFADLAFKLDGTLLGVTGDGANVPETLYILSKTGATQTFVCALGNGDEGESIFFADNVLYHASGFTNVIFETVNLGNNCATTDIPNSGDFDLEVSGSTLCAGEILAANLSGEILSITPGGFGTDIGDTDGNFIATGLACPFPVGGTVLSPDTVSLLLLEAESSAVWWLPSLVLAGAGLALFKIKKKN